MRLRLTIFALSLAVSLAACGGDDDGVGLSGDPLTEAEAQALARVVMSQGLEASEEGVAATAARVAGSPAAAVPVEVHRSISVENVPCPLGGAFSVSGTLEGTVDSATEDVDATYTLQHSHSSCGVAPEGVDVEFTLDGNPNVAHTYDLLVDGGTSVELSGNIDGVVDWATDDGRSGTCPLNFTVDVSGFSLSETTGSVSVSVDGIVCGVTISESLTVEPEQTS